jgi:hypothetical protein
MSKRARLGRVVSGVAPRRLNETSRNLKGQHSMPTLTKSLHTVTAVTRVAHYLLVTLPGSNPRSAAKLVGLALDILGYDVSELPKSDDTVARCVRSVETLMAAIAAGKE